MVIFRNKREKKDVEKGIVRSGMAIEDAATNRPIGAAVNAKNAFSDFDDAYKTSRQHGEHVKSRVNEMPRAKTKRIDPREKSSSVNVNGYTRKDGTEVEDYTRKKPKRSKWNARQ
jgi:hypothetical protein